MSSPDFSVIVPVYNRPGEVQELLESLARPNRKDFEVIIVEDGSSVRCENVIDTFRDRLNIQYIYKPNSGPGPSRNMGFRNAKGNFFVVFDSDCIIPAGYFDAVEKGIAEFQLDAWGGPDKAHQDFSVVQRAMGYTMSSVLTTGGIRGAKKTIGWFQPRSFNMGISRKVFEVTGGFNFDRYAEDIELSIRIKKAGFRVGLIPEAYVYHKRRTSLGQFYHQVFNFGRGRAMVGRVHPDALRPVHWLPALFTLGIIVLLMMSMISPGFFSIGFSLLAVYFLSIFLHAFGQSKNLMVAILAVPATIIQFVGYGLGFLKERLK